MKLLFVLCATFLVASAAVVEQPKINFQEAQMLAEFQSDLAESDPSEFGSTTWCLVKLAWKLKQAGINGYGPWKDLIEDLTSTTLKLGKHALKCRRLKKNITNIWGEIAYQTCRATLAASGAYEVLRLRKDIKETVENDFWLIGIRGLRECLKKDTEVLKQMDWAELDRELDLMNNY